MYVLVSAVAHITTNDVPAVMVFMFGIHDTVPPGILFEMITLDAVRIFAFVTVIEPPDVQTNVPDLPAGKYTGPVYVPPLDSIVLPVPVGGPTATPWIPVTVQVPALMHVRSPPIVDDTRGPPVTAWGSEANELDAANRRNATSSFFMINFP